MTMDTIERRLAAGEVLLLDGGTGTELEKRGAAMVDGAWCAMATRTDPDILLGVHEDYIRAGADIIVTNTYANARHMLEAAGHADKTQALAREAAEIALRARDRAAGGRAVAIGGSLSHMMPMQPGGERNDPNRYPPDATVLENFRELAGLHKDAGVDFIMLEMMSRPRHIRLAMQAAEETGLPIWCGMSARSHEGKIVSFAFENHPFEETVAAALSGSARVVGVMHSNVNVTGPALALLREQFDGPMLAYPDSGHFEMPHWNFKDIIDPPDLAREARAWLDMGVQAIGGCCGLGLEHIKALAAELKAA
jgi:S-methylmethionine-dependent homocysteine/selenocysteine methylase